jgi:hypothetical protein
MGGPYQTEAAAGYNFAAQGVANDASSLTDTIDRTVAGLSELGDVLAQVRVRLGVGKPPELIGPESGSPRPPLDFTAGRLASMSQGLLRDAHEIARAIG